MSECIWFHRFIKGFIPIVASYLGITVYYRPIEDSRWFLAYGETSTIYKWENFKAYAYHNGEWSDCLYGGIFSLVGGDSGKVCKMISKNEAFLEMI